MAPSIEAVKYTNYIDPSNEFSRYDTKQSDGEASNIEELWRMWSTPIIAIVHMFTRTRSGSTC